MSEFPWRNEDQPSVYEVLDAARPLLELFGVQPNPIEQPPEFLEAIAQLDPRFGAGRELVRWQLEADETQWDEETRHCIMETAQKLRMFEKETPLVGHYDAVIALGGARQSNIDRLRYPIACTKENPDASFGHLIIGGSARKLNEQEQENTANYAPGAQTEFDLCVAAAKIVAQENPSLIPAISFTPDERAGTPQVLENVFNALQKSDVVTYGESAIAAVTTQIYQVATDMDLRRVAKKFGITDVFVAGNPSDPQIIAKRTPATYLTEIVRTLKAAAMAAEADVI